VLLKDLNFPFAGADDLEYIAEILDGVELRAINYFRGQFADEMQVVVLALAFLGRVDLDVGVELDLILVFEQS
jgi:hypothetical protein